MNKKNFKPVIFSVFFFLINMYAIGSFLAMTHAAFASDLIVDPLLGTLKFNSPTVLSSNKQMVGLLSLYLNQASLQDRFSGVVLIANGKSILFENAYGLANKETQTANNLQTKFALASLGKTFTMIGIAKLVQEGKVKLDSPISQYLSSGWLPQNELKSITVQELLTHTSGLGDYMDEKSYDAESRSGKLTTVQSYQSLIYNTPVMFKPGASYYYSNSGYMLLGAIIESVSHEAYSKFIQKNIFDPAGMENSGYPLFTKPIQNFSTGYYNNTLYGSMAWKNGFDLSPLTRGMPDGDAVSTAEDMFKFSESLNQKKLLNAEYTKQVLATSPYPGTSNHYNSFGFDVCGSDIQVNPSIYGICQSPYMVGKSGLAPGESTYLAYFPEGEYTVIVLSNYTQGRTNVTGEIYSLIKERLAKSS